MNPSRLVPGTKLWVRVRSIRTALVEITNVGPTHVTFRWSTGATCSVTHKRFWCLAGKELSEPTYQTTVIPLGGGWKDYPVKGGLKAAVEQAWHQALQPYVRKVGVPRLLRCGLRRVVLELASYDERVWMGRSGNRALMPLIWNGTTPSAEDGLIEVTNKYQRDPSSYVI